jgi:hypothetical protein
MARHFEALARHAAASVSEQSAHAKVGTKAATVTAARARAKTGIICRREMALRSLAACSRARTAMEIFSARASRCADQRAVSVAAAMLARTGMGPGTGIVRQKTARTQETTANRNALRMQ